MQFLGLCKRTLAHFHLLAPCAATVTRIGAFVFALIAGLFVAPALGQTLSEAQIRQQQEMLVWTTDYEGLVDGKFGPETISGINKFQSRIGHAPTGRLTPEEMRELARQGTSKKQWAGFQEITDHDAGIAVGIPKHLVSGPTRTKWGNQWYGRGAGLAIDTLRFGGDVSLDQLFSRLRSINNRVVAYERKITNDWFVIAAFEKDAAVYVRANVVLLPNEQSEIRGFSIWMSKDRPKDYQAIPPAMLSSFTSNTSAPPPPSPPGPMASYPSLRPNPPPIATARPAASIGECFRGLGDCPSMLTFR
jgi:peptidoglycan hydrolase-like protein with peptidoglycan-binding domain